MSMPFESAVSGTKGLVSKPADSHTLTQQLESCSTGTRFFDEHARRAKNYAMSIVRRWADAEEITQEAFCKLIQNETMSKAVSDSAARAILFTTIRNLSIDCLRKRGTRKHKPLDEQNIASPNHLHSEIALEKLEAGIENAMKELPEEWAEALRLKVNAKLSYTEIADVLSATHGQIRMWIFRARKQLHEDLKKSGLLEQSNAI